MRKFFSAQSNIVLWISTLAIACSPVAGAQTVSSKTVSASFHGTTFNLPILGNRANPIATGPTLPPPIDEDLRIATGPTLPPPIDEDLRIATGPTLPPPIDEDLRIATGPTLPLVDRRLRFGLGNLMVCLRT